MTKHGDPEVLRAHPRLVCHALALTRGGRYVYAHLFAPTLVERTAEDLEDLDALPVDEQAAIVCACRASDHSCPEAAAEEMLPDGPVAVLAWSAYAVARDFRGGSPRRGPMTWAEAEASLRTGKVRP